MLWSPLVLLSLDQTTVKKRVIVRCNGFSIVKYYVILGKFDNFLARGVNVLNYMSNTQSC